TTLARSAPGKGRSLFLMRLNSPIPARDTGILPVRVTLRAPAPSQRFRSMDVSPMSLPIRAPGRTTAHQKQTRSNPPKQTQHPHWRHASRDLSQNVTSKTSHDEPTAINPPRDDPHSPSPAYRYHPVTMLDSPATALAPDP